VVSLFSLSGCEEPADVPVAIGTNIWPGYEPGYIAKEQQLYGVTDVTLRQFRSATEVLRAFRNQSIDIAALTLDEALMLRHSGIPIKIFLVADVSNGADAIVAKPDIASMQGLIGKRVGVENSALGAYVLGRALQQHGMSDRDIRQVSITVDETVDAFTKNRVDAVVTFDPFKSQLLRGEARQIFDSRAIPDEIIDVLVARDEFLIDHPEAVAAVVSGWLEGAKRLASGDPKILEETARRLGMTVPELKTALKELTIPAPSANRALLDGRINPVVQASKKLIPLLEKRNKVLIDVAPEDMTTSQFLPMPDQP
jgi:NitT/TauT family transport system substrate-binding protein